MSTAEIELAAFAKVYELLLSHPIRSAFREEVEGPEDEPPPQDPEMLVAVQADRFDLMTAVRELRRHAQAELFLGDFTDTARCALLWVLWHHQGGSSGVGQAMRFALGKGAHDELTEYDVEQAKKWEALDSSTADGVASGSQPDPFTVSAALRRLIADDAYAMTFQTFGQYRTALLKAIDAATTAATSSGSDGVPHVSIGAREGSNS